MSSKATKLSISERAISNSRETRRLRRSGQVPGILYGGTEEPFAFSVDGIASGEAAARLGERGFAVWHGNYYALEVMKRLGLEDDGGAVRVGFVHYNTSDEVDRLLAELARLE